MWNMKTNNETPVTPPSLWQRYCIWFDHQSRSRLTCVIVGEAAIVAFFGWLASSLCAPQHQITATETVLYVASIFICCIGWPVLALRWKAGNGTKSMCWLITLWLSLFCALQAHATTPGIPASNAAAIQQNVSSQSPTQAQPKVAPCPLIFLLLLLLLVAAALFFVYWTICKLLG